MKEREREFVVERWTGELSVRFVPVAEIDRPILDKPDDVMGTLTFEHSDNVVPDLECDRIAYSNGTMLAASFVTTPTQMKAIRAILHSKKGKVGIRTEGITTQYPSRSKDVAYDRLRGGVLNKEDCGYNLWVYKMDYGKIHATVISKSRNLIMYSSPESVWGRLVDSEFYETPMIKEWMPYITKKLVENKYLRECRCYRCNCAVLDIQKREQLDEIITDGLRAGLIQIP